MKKLSIISISGEREAQYIRKVLMTFANTYSNSGVIPPDSLYACVLAGGSGERFWPLSRTSKPKHLISLLTANTLLEQTVERLCLIVPKEQILILTSESQIEDCQKVLGGLHPSQFIIEPSKRDTAAACALGTALVHRINPNATVGFFAADAMVRNSALFASQIKEAYNLAASTDNLVALGIRPNSPSTRFGYLEVGEVHPSSNLKCNFYRVERFLEKPDEKTAKELLAADKYLWNAGVFIWKTSSFQRELEKYNPVLATFYKELAEFKGDYRTFLADTFSKLPKISVDYALLEHSHSLLVGEARFDWDDVGSWTALPTHLPPDAGGNTLQGEVVCHASRRNIVSAQTCLVALCGVDDLVVVQTPDAVLVCHREAAEQIKKLQPLLPERVR